MITAGATQLEQVVGLILWKINHIEQIINYHKITKENKNLEATLSSHPFELISLKTRAKNIFINKIVHEKIMTNLFSNHRKVN